MRLARIALYLAVALAVPARAAPAQNPGAQPLNPELLAKALVTEAGRRGLSVLTQLPPKDWDADGKPELVAACKTADNELVIAFFRALPQNRVTHLWQGPATGAEELRSMEFRDLVGDERPELLVELAEQDPDETRRQVRVYRAQSGAIKEILSMSFPEREANRDPARISFGDDKPGYRIDDVERGGDQEFLVKREPRVLNVLDRNGDPLAFVLGVRESVYVFEHDNGDGGAYVAGKDRFTNFLPGYKPTKVTASSQRLPDDAAKEDPDDAVVFGMEDISIDAPAAGAPAAPKPAKEHNPAPKAFWAADNNLDTAWIEGVRGAGEKEWVQLDLAEKQDIHLIRIIPVCAGSEDDFKNHNEITAFTLELGGMRIIHVDRTEKQPGDYNILAQVEAPAPERKFAPQLLVFPQKGIKANSVKLTVDKVKKRGKANETCVAEISVH